MPRALPYSFNFNLCSITCSFIKKKKYYLIWMPFWRPWSDVKATLFVKCISLPGSSVFDRERYKFLDCICFARKIDLCKKRKTFRIFHRKFVTAFAFISYGRTQYTWTCADDTDVPLIRNRKCSMNPRSSYLLKLKRDRTFRRNDILNDTIRSQ